MNLKLIHWEGVDSVCPDQGRVFANVVMGLELSWTDEQREERRCMQLSTCIVCLKQTQSGRRNIRLIVVFCER
jgi:hypothetical protein